jgi:hypothetical protein
MAGLSLQDQNLVWQKVNHALSVQSVNTTAAGGGSGSSADPASQNAFKALKLQLATQKLAPQLQFVPFSYANLTGATGYQFGISGSFHLYGLWAKKTGTGTTGTFLDVFDAETTTATSFKFASVLTTGSSGAPGDEAVHIYPKGLAFGTDVTIIVATTATGGTASTGAGDIINGFAVIGA